MKIIKATRDYDSSIDEGFDSISNLSFKKGDLIFLKNKIDKYWGEGFIISDNDKLFPLNFTDEIELEKFKAYPVKKGAPRGTRVEAKPVSLSGKKKKKKKKQTKKEKSRK